MSMIGNYRRLSEAKLRELIAHPKKLSWFLYRKNQRDDGSHLDINKTWHIIHFLLNGQTWEGTWPLVGVVMGGTPISEEDVGYGPARYLTAKEVQEVSSALSAISPDALWSRLDAEALRQAEIYPEGWCNESDDRHYVTSYYSALRHFFAMAAQAR